MERPLHYIQAEHGGQPGVGRGKTMILADERDGMAGTESASGASIRFSGQRNKLGEEEP